MRANIRRAALVSLAAILTILAVIAGKAVAAAPPELDGRLARRLRDLVLRGRSFEYARGLTETFGPRLTGSRSYERAAEWAVQQFQAAGLRDAALDSFTIEHAWERGPVRARIVELPAGPEDGDSGGDRTLHLEPLGWTPSTPEGGVEGDVVFVREGSGSTIVPSVVKGRVVFADGPAETATAPASSTGHREFDSTLRDAGALAILVADSGPGNTLTARPREYNTAIAPLPTAEIGHEDAARIRRLAARGPVRVAFEYHNRISAGPVETHNVIAEIRGRERPDEWIVVSAHLDSWDFATGAQDNATGVAMVIEAARAIALVGRPPRRSIRFALWGGEEQGMQGSSAYVRAHEAELGRCLAILNTDGGTGRILGWTAPGREDVQRAVEPIAHALLSPLGAGAIDISLQYAFDSDHAPFIRAGIPALDLNPDDSHYEDIHHKATDVLDRVDRHNLAVGAAVVAMTAFAIADAQNALAPRLPLAPPPLDPQAFK